MENQYITYMKIKILIFLLIISWILFASSTNAQMSLWKVISGVLQPVVSWEIKLPATTTFEENLIIEDNPISYDGDISNAFAINSVGDFAFGTNTVATHKMTIWDEVNTTLWLQSPNTGGAGMTGITFDQYNQGASGERWIIANENSYNNGLLFRYVSGSDDVLFMATTGYVGIQTTNPAYTLDVAGEIHSQNTTTAAGLNITDGTNGVRIIPGATTTLEFY